MNIDHTLSDIVGGIALIGLILVGLLVIGLASGWHPPENATFLNYYSLTGAVNVNATIGNFSTIQDDGVDIATIYVDDAGDTMSGDLAMGNNDITGAANVNSTDMASDCIFLTNNPSNCTSGSNMIGYSSNLSVMYCADYHVNTDGDTMTGDLNFSSASITNATNVNATTFYQGGNILSDVSGFTMTGDIVMGDNNVTGVQWLNATKTNLTTQILTSDGLTYSTIQAAVDGLAGDGWIYVPPGTYTERVTLNTNNTSLFGSGRATIIDGTGTAATTGAIVISGAHDVIVRDLTAQVTSSGHNVDGIMITGTTSRILIDNIYIPDSDRMGIEFYSSTSTDTTIRDCIIDSIDLSGIYVTNSAVTNTIITNNLVSNTGSTAVGLDGNNSVFSDNIVYDSFADCVHIMSSAHNASVFGNIFKGCASENIDNDGTDSRVSQPTYATDLPGSCSANIEGAQYSDASLNMPCYCNGSGWVQMNDYTTGC